MTRPWTIHSERKLYESPWVGVSLADVETPSGRRFDHHVVRVPAEGAGAAVVDPLGRVLLIHRHRFAVDRWGWELPAGRVDPGETD
nr:NUDIX domain-containing protein [Micromonospora sp. DSM 115978]